MTCSKQCGTEKYELVKISRKPNGGVGAVAKFGSDLISAIEYLAKVGRIKALRVVIRCSLLLDWLALIKSWCDGCG